MIILRFLLFIFAVLLAAPTWAGITLPSSSQKNTSAAPQSATTTPVTTKVVQRDFDLGDTMNFDQCLDFDYKIAGCWAECRIGKIWVPVPGIKVDYKEPTAMAEVTFRRGFSHLEGEVNPLNDALGVWPDIDGQANDAGGGNLGEEGQKSFAKTETKYGPESKYFFDVNVWGISPIARFESQGSTVDVAKSLACTYAENSSKLFSMMAGSMPVDAAQFGDLANPSNLQAMADVAQTVGQVQQTVEQVTSFAQNPLGTIMGQASAALGQVVGQVVTPITDAVGNVVGTVTESVGDGVSTVTGAIGDATGFEFPSFTPAQETAVVQISDNLSQASTAVIQNTQDTLQNSPAISRAAGSINQKLSGLTRTETTVIPASGSGRDYEPARTITEQKPLGVPGLNIQQLFSSVDTVDAILRKNALLQAVKAHIGKNIPIGLWPAYLTAWEEEDWSGPPLGIKGNMMSFFQQALMSSPALYMACGGTSLANQLGGGVAAISSLSMQLESFMNCLGKDGPLYPQNGWSNHPVEIAASMVVGYRAFHLAKTLKTVDGNQKRKAGTREYFNLDYPHKSACFQYGTIEDGWQSPSGTGLSSAFLNPSSLSGLIPDKDALSLDVSLTRIQDYMMGRSSANPGELEETGGVYNYTIWKESSCCVPPPGCRGEVYY